MATKKETLYGVQLRAIALGKGPERERWCVVRKADDKVMAQHNDEASAREQAAGLESRAARGVA